jgi:hypothetical protein
MGYRRNVSVVPIVVGVLVLGSASTALATAGGAGPARGWRTVTFSGVSVRVPSSWPVVRLERHPAACPRLDVHAVYLGAPGRASLCPAAAGGKTEAVVIGPANPQSPDAREATRAVTIGGRAARTNPDSALTHAITDLLPAAGVEVSLSYGTDRALAREIGSTITIGPAARSKSVGPAGSVPVGPPQGYYRGPGFDTCAAPSAAAMKSWLGSRFRAVGVYIGGVNRSCAQADLTAGWLAAIQAAGWHYFPLYAGLQATCVLHNPGDVTITPRKAASEGRTAAQDAAAQARNLGIPAGTPLIYDMEAYSGCTRQVIRFLGAWDGELHHESYRAGIYESFSNIGDLIRAAGEMIEPDVINYADWDGRANAWSSYMPADMWTEHQRIHQYQGGHYETFGGVTLGIDSDQLNVNLGADTGVALAGRPARAAGRSRPAAAGRPVTAAAALPLPPTDGSGACRSPRWPCRAG